MAYSTSVKEYGDQSIISNGENFDFNCVILSQLGETQPCTTESRKTLFYNETISVCILAKDLKTAPQLETLECIYISATYSLGHKPNSDTSTLNLPYQYSITEFSPWKQASIDSKPYLYSSADIELPCSMQRLYSMSDKDVLKIDVMLKLKQKIGNSPQIYYESNRPATLFPPYTLQKRPETSSFEILLECQATMYRAINLSIVLVPVKLNRYSEIKTLQYAITSNLEPFHDRGVQFQLKNLRFLTRNSSFLTNIEKIHNGPASDENSQFGLRFPEIKSFSYMLTIPFDKNSIDEDVLQRGNFSISFAIHADVESKWSDEDLAASFKISERLDRQIIIPEDVILSLRKNLPISRDISRQYCSSILVSACILEHQIQIGKQFTIKLTIHNEGDVPVDSFLYTKLPMENMKHSSTKLLPASRTVETSATLTYCSPIFGVKPLIPLRKLRPGEFREVYWPFTAVQRGTFNIDKDSCGLIILAQNDTHQVPDIHTLEPGLHPFNSHSLQVLEKIQVHVI